MEPGHQRVMIATLNQIIKNYPQFSAISILRRATGKCEEGIAAGAFVGMARRRHSGNLLLPLCYLPCAGISNGFSDGCAPAFPI